MNRLIKTACIVLLCALASPAWASNEMDAGIASFGKKDYRTALAHFTAVLNADPNNYNALYYEAVTFYKLGQVDYAKQAYATLITLHPNTQAAKNAETALNYIDSGYLRKFQQKVYSAARNATPTTSTSANTNYGSTASYSDSSSTTPDNNLANLPDQVTIPYVKHGNNLLVNAFINDRSIPMYFDSGAEDTMVYKSQVQSIGLKDPHGAPVGYSYGVGNGGAQRVWQVRTRIKVGQIEHNNFPVSVQDDGGAAPTYPLLGENFFRGFSYQILPPADDGHGSIVFRKKSQNGSFSAASGDIPYRDMGTEMIVDVQVNGRTVPMIFDTGAETCLFTMHQWVEVMKMNVPDDAVNSMNVGVAGAVESKSFTVDTMRLGPIIQHDVPVSIVRGSNIPYGLLGHSFFGNLRINVDNSAHLIRIRR